MFHTNPQQFQQSPKLQLQSQQQSQSQQHFQSKQSKQHFRSQKSQQHFHSQQQEQERLRSQEQQPLYKIPLTAMDSLSVNAATSTLSSSSLSSNQSTSDQSTSDQSTSDQSTSDQSTSDQSSAAQSVTSTDAISLSYDREQLLAHKLAQARHPFTLLFSRKQQAKLAAKKASDDISIHWRPNYELALSNLWVGLAVGYFILGVGLSLGEMVWKGVGGVSTWLAIFGGWWQSVPTHCLLLALASLGLAWTFYPQGIHNQQWLQQRYKRKLLLTNAQELPQVLEPNRWWLGKGFYWDSKHSFRQQALQQHFTMYQHPQFGKQGGTLGSTWIHTLEYQEQPIHIDCEHTNGHMLIVGTTGSGKTRAFDLLIQQAILRQESVIIIDPKGDHDLRDKALATAHRLGMADRFLAFSPAFAQQSIALDLLGNYAKTSDLAQRIISLMPNSAHAGPFKAVSYKAVFTIIESLQHLHKKITLSRIYLCVTVGLKDLLLELMLDTARTYKIEEFIEPLSKGEIDTRSFKAILRKYVKEYHPLIQLECVVNLIELYNHDSTHLNKMLATLLPGLHVLATPPMNALITPELDLSSDRILFNLQSLTTTNYILYVGLDSLSDATLSGNIGSLLLSDLAALAGTIYNYKDVKKPINIFVDEAGEVVNDAFIQILNKGRGAGLRCFTATQTIADFNVRTGDREKTRQMLGNFNNWLALRTTDFETQKYLAESLRRTRIQVKQSSYAHKDAFTDNSYADQVNHENTPLVTPDLLAELPNFEYIARMAGGQIIKGRLPIVTSGEE